MCIKCGQNRQIKDDLLWVLRYDRIQTQRHWVDIPIILHPKHQTGQKGRIQVIQVENINLITLVGQNNPRL